MTTKESFDALAAIEAEKNPYEFTREEWRSFTEEQKNARYELIHQWRDEHEARWLKAVRAIVPEVGIPCTICYWSDKRAATVARIISPTKIEIDHNEVKCLDFYAGEYEILPKLQERTEVFTKRRNGLWVMEGQKSKDGVKLMLHYQDHYIDPSY